MRTNNKTRRPSEVQKLKALSAELEPTLWVGKNGVNDAIVDELCEQLKLRKIVKVRILKTALLETTRGDIARKLGHASGATLVELKGATVIYRSPYRVKKTPQNLFTSEKIYKLKGQKNA